MGQEGGHPGGSSPWSNPPFDLRLSCLFSQSCSMVKLPHAVFHLVNALDFLEGGAGREHCQRGSLRLSFWIGISNASFRHYSSARTGSAFRFARQEWCSSMDQAAIILFDFACSSRCLHKSHCLSRVCADPPCQIPARLSDQICTRRAPNSRFLFRQCGESLDPADAVDLRAGGYQTASY